MVDSGIADEPWQLRGQLLRAAFGKPGESPIGRAMIASAPALQHSTPSLARLIGHSTLWAVLAFNLMFLAQELMLVLPKAMVPGLHPVLFHNNHDWTGDRPIAELLQGSGALSITLLAALVLALLARRPLWSPSGKLAACWLAFAGAYQALPQLIIGAFVAQNDVGRAMRWVGMGDEVRIVTALIGIALMIAVGWRLVPHFLSLVPGARRWRALAATVWLPSMMAIVLIVPFRVPGSIDQVALVPPIVMLGGALAVALAAIAGRPAARPVEGPLSSVGWPLAGLAAIALLFHGVLRHGVAF